MEYSGSDSSILYFLAQHPDYSNSHKLVGCLASERNKDVAMAILGFEAPEWAKQEARYFKACCKG